MKRAIITGATGFVGVHLAEELISRAVEVIAITRTESAHIDRLPEAVTVINCGLDDYDQLLKRVKNEKPDVFYHLAWEGISWSECGRTNAFVQIQNVRRTLYALQAAKEANCLKFVAAGTASENYHTQIARASGFRDIAFYALSKKYVRDMARQFSFQLGIDFTWCTFGHPVGRYLKQDLLFTYAVHSLLNGDSPTFGSGKNWTDVIHIKDLAVGLYLAGEQKLSKTDYHIGSGEPRVLKDYLTELITGENKLLPCFP